MYDVTTDQCNKDIDGINYVVLTGNFNDSVALAEAYKSYGIRSFCGGKVYYEPKYPNIYFAIDGEIYTFEGKKYMVVGGAHSVDSCIGYYAVVVRGLGCNAFSE